MRRGGRTRSAVGLSRRRDRTGRSRRLWVLLCCATVLGGLIFLFTVRGIRIRDLRHQLQSSLLGYEEVLIERQDLESQLALKDDLASIENAARERLGWVKPGEERVIFVDRTEESSGGGE